MAMAPCSVSIKGLNDGPAKRDPVVMAMMSMDMNSLRFVMPPKDFIV